MVVADCDLSGFFPQAVFGIWNLTNPRRDAAMDNTIVVHEFAHGLTNRLVGGGTARCLQGRIARGLGEGWSDFIAE